MRKLIIASLVLIILCDSCLILRFKDGSKIRQLLPAKDNMDFSDLDTGKFTKQPFDFSDYTGKVAYRHKKKIFEPIRGSDIRKIVNSIEVRYYLYFWNSICPGTNAVIHRLDSLSLKGAQILILSERNQFDVINRRLDKTSFSKYPCYIIETEKPSKALLLRQINFIKEACETCGQDNDDVSKADIVFLENGVVKPIFYNDTSSDNILKN